MERFSSEHTVARSRFCSRARDLSSERVNVTLYSLILVSVVVAAGEACTESAAQSPALFLCADGRLRSLRLRCRPHEQATHQTARPDSRRQQTHRAHAHRTAPLYLSTCCGGLHPMETHPPWGERVHCVHGCGYSLLVPKVRWRREPVTAAAAAAWATSSPPGPADTQSGALQPPEPKRLQVERTRRLAQLRAHNNEACIFSHSKQHSLQHALMHYPLHPLLSGLPLSSEVAAIAPPTVPAPPIAAATIAGFSIG